MWYRVVYDAEFRRFGTTSSPFGVLRILRGGQWLIFFPFCHSANGSRRGTNLSKNSCGSLSPVQCDIGRSFCEKFCGISTNPPRSVKALGSVAIFLICGDFWRTIFSQSSELQLLLFNHGRESHSQNGSGVKRQFVVLR